MKKFIPVILFILVLSGYFFYKQNMYVGNIEENFEQLTIYTNNALGDEYKDELKSNYTEAFEETLSDLGLEEVSVEVKITNPENIVQAVSNDKTAIGFVYPLPYIATQRYNNDTYNTEALYITEHNADTENGTVLTNQVTHEQDFYFMSTSENESEYSSKQVIELVNYIHDENKVIGIDSAKYSADQILFFKLITDLKLNVDEFNIKYYDNEHDKYNALLNGDIDIAISTQPKYIYNMYGSLDNITFINTDYFAMKPQSKIVIGNSEASIFVKEVYAEIFDTMTDSDAIDHISYGYGINYFADLKGINDVETTKFILDSLDTYHNYLNYKEHNDN